MPIVTKREFSGFSPHRTKYFPALDLMSSLFSTYQPFLDVMQDDLMTIAEQLSHLPNERIELSKYAVECSIIN